MCNHSNQCTQQLTQPAHQNTHPLLLVLPFVNSKWREFDWFRKSKWISNNKSMSLLKSKTMLFVRHLFGELVHSFSLFVHAPVCSVTALRYNLQVWKSRGKIQGKKFSYIQSSLLVLLLLSIFSLAYPRTCIFLTKRLHFLITKVLENISKRKPAADFWRNNH